MHSCKVCKEKINLYKSKFNKKRCKDCYEQYKAEKKAKQFLKSFMKSVSKYK